MPVLPEEALIALLSASPMVLALLIALASVLLAAFALYVVHKMVSRGEKD